MLESPKRRPKALALLSHSLALDPRWSMRIEHGIQSIDGILALLNKRDATPTCYVISEDRLLDGNFVPLRDAVTRVVGSGMGSVLSCIPGKLAYYEGESPGTRYILERRKAL